MPKVSFITAVTRAELLPGLYQSIAAQSVDWEWNVQLDGAAIDWQPGPENAEMSRDPRVSLSANPRPLGSGTTRNLALTRSSGDFVLCLDDDDLLYADSVSSLCAALEARPQCFGAWGRTDLLTAEAPDAHPQVFRSWPTPGVIDAGTLGEQFQRTGKFAVHVGAVLWRRSHLVAVGGYGALPRSIDTNPFLAAEALFPVCYVDTAVYRYRRHDEQMSAKPEYQTVKEQVHRFNFDRMEQLRLLLKARTID